MWGCNSLSFVLIRENINIKKLSTQRGCQPMIKHLKMHFTIWIFISFISLMGCVSLDSVDGNEIINKAVVKLHPTEGNTANGVVWFTKVVGGVKVEGHIEGLSAGTQGFHIHQLGDCSAGNGKSAGGQFNPEGSEHGSPMAAVRHTGDLGNITADSTGSANFSFIDEIISFSGKRSILGRGVIIHEVADDFSSQPTGAAGSRLACGVVGIAYN